MDEFNGLELAIESCQDVERSLMKSIKMVRRLNVRFNTEWLMKNYQSYVQGIIRHYELACEQYSYEYMPIVKLGKYPLKLSRSTTELCINNCRINCRFIKFKRSMETLMLLLAHAIDISNRQKNYVHMNEDAKTSQTRLCFH